MFRKLLPVIYFIAGIALLLGMFDIASWVTAKNKIPIPSASKVLGTIYDLWKHPFYDNGPNDKGIGYQLLKSLTTVFKGFLMATLVALPVGYMRKTYSILYCHSIPGLTNTITIHIIHFHICYHLRGRNSFYSDFSWINSCCC